MLQMWPWKMSLLLEGNNNSKFQLLFTLQSSVFPSDRIRRGGESEYLSIDDFPSSHPSILALPVPPLLCLAPTGAPATHTPSSREQTPTRGSPLNQAGRAGETKRGRAPAALPLGGHCPLAKMPSSPASFPEPLSPAPLLAAASPPPSPFKYR